MSRKLMNLALMYTAITAYASEFLQSQETKAIYEVVWYEDGGFVIKDSVGGGHLLNFLGSILSVFKFKVVGNKFEVAYGKTNNN